MAIIRSSSDHLTLGADGANKNIIFESNGTQVASISSAGNLTSTGIDDNATSTAITIDSSENVGIGTSSPARNMVVSGSSTTSSLLLQNSATGAASTDGVLLQSNGVDTYLWNYESGSLVMATNNAERMRIDSSGHAIIPAGVTLGTSAGTYAAANTLDDYEEGTWTPSLSAGGNTDATFGANNGGGYTKIGNKVHLQGRLSVNSIGSLSGPISLTGFPFTSSSSHNMSVISVGRATSLAITAGQSITGWVSQGVTYSELQRWDAAAGTTDLTAAELSAGADVMFIVEYLAA